MSKRLLKLAAITAIAISSLQLTGCGQAVEVGPAQVGKILTKNGYAPETITPSKFRLPPCLFYCDKLITMEANDKGFKETMEIFMPVDKLNLHVEVRGTLSVPTTAEAVNTLFDRIVPDQNDMITTTSVYNTYGVQAIRGIVRSEVAKHRISDILANREAVGQNIHDAIVSKMKSTKIPLVVSRFELAEVIPPKVIVAAQEAAKEREIDIQKAEADAQVALVEAERALEVAKKDRLVEREKAEAIAEQNRIAANSITPQVLEYKRLEAAVDIWKAISQSSNSLIIPADSTAALGVQQSATFARMLGRELKQ